MKPVHFGSSGALIGSGVIINIEIFVYCIFLLHLQYNSKIEHSHA